jgi:hypothetical protein
MLPLNSGGGNCCPYCQLHGTLRYAKMCFVLEAMPVTPCTPEAWLHISMSCCLLILIFDTIQLFDLTLNLSSLSELTGFLC